MLLERLGPDPALRAAGKRFRRRRSGRRRSRGNCWRSAGKQMLEPKVLDLNAVVTENLDKMLQRLIGEDIDAGDDPADRSWGR